MKRLCLSSYLQTIDKYYVMKNLELIAEELFNNIRGRFPSITIGDEEGKVTDQPKTARFFDFQYKQGAKSLGSVSVTLTDEAVQVMYNTDFVAKEDTLTRNEWYNFLKELRMFAKKRLLNFTSLKTVIMLWKNNILKHLTTKET